MAFFFSGLIKIVIITDSIWSSSGVHLESGWLIMCSEVESIQSRWVHLEAAGLQPDSRWTPGGLQAHWRLTFEGMTTKEKLVEGHLESIWTPPESRWSPTGICGGV
jgi:hypothetical protein